MFNNYDDERPNPIFKIMAQYKLIAIFNKYRNNKMYFFININI